MTEPIARIVPSKPDAELAEEFKRRLIEAAEPMLKLMGEIDAAGFEANTNFGKGALGNFIITHMRIAKVY